MSSYTCKICSKQFSSSQGLNGHIRSHNPSSYPKHLRCCSIFSKKEIAISQLETHNNAFLASQHSGICKRCKKTFTAQIKHNYIPQYCSRSCANSRNHSIETREKISKKQYSETERQLRFTPYLLYTKIKYITCLKCSVLFCDKLTSKKRYCSNCRLQYSKIYKRDCSFNLNKNDHPELFDSNLIQQYGWYRPPSCKNPNYQGATWDHLYPIHEGFRNNIPPEIMKHPANAELVPFKENLRRYREHKETITLEELYKRINSWDSGDRQLPKYYLK